jgi:HK97 family phage major capsid protein
MDEMVTINEAVKAMPDGKLYGVGIRFGGKDLTGDYFAPDTYIGEAETLPTMYQHGFDPKLGKRIIGKSRRDKTDEVGIWFETQLNLRDDYEKMIYELAKEGKLAYSTGTSPHALITERTEKGNLIKQWLLTEISLTPTPAEPMNSVIPLKSLLLGDNKTDPEQPTHAAEAEQDTAPTVADTKAVTQDLTINKESTMDNEVKTEAVLTPEQAALIAKQAAEEAVKAYRASEPPINEDKTHVQVTEDPADRPFKSIAEQMQAVKAYEVSMGRDEHARIKYLKATGASEGIPSDGGLLLDPTLVAEFIQPIHEEGPFSSAVRRLPVGSNSNYGWINGVDETSRATGSRWGGVRGYRLAEAATKTASKPAFRRINWELKKYAVVVYGTDELLADAAQFSAIVNQACREELSFMVNDDIMNGLGLAGPQGFMQSGSLITVTRADANDILGADISAMYNRMDPRGRRNAVWYIGNDSQPKLDKLFAVGSTAVLFPYASIGLDGVQRLYGRPIVVTEFNQTLGTAGDIVFADLSQYLFWEKGGVEAATSIHVQFLTDETAFRFVYRCDGQSSVASALTPYKGTTTTSPFVNLLATS